MLSYLIHEAVHNFRRYEVNAVVIVAVLREIALNLIINDYSVLVTYTFYLCVFYCAKRVRDNGKSRNTRRKPTLNLSVMERHLQLFIAIFIVHVVNNIKRIYV